MPDGERVPSFEAMAWHCDPAREKYGVIPGRCPDRMHPFVGFNLVTILSRLNKNHTARCCDGLFYGGGHIFKRNHAAPCGFSPEE